MEKFDRGGFMTREQAERIIWSYYWQLDHSRDRRVAPLATEPPDTIDRDELARIRDAQTPLWRKAQLKAVDILERKNARVGSVARRFAGLFTTKAEQEYVLQCVLEEERERLSAQDLSGRVDPGTGLPLSTADVQSGGRGVVAGQELCLEAIVPPHDLAESATTWLPPCPPEESPETWGSELSHWQALHYKPKDKQCETCGGRGRVEKRVTASVGRGFLIRREKTEHRTFLVTCENCHGEGCKQNWDPDEVEAVRQNARTIAEVVHDLANEGYFDLRPIDERDAVMGDLVWERKDGFTIGFRLNWEGYQRMQEFTQEDPEIQKALHILTLAGEEVRSKAPEWALNEYRGGGPSITTQGRSFKNSPAQSTGLKLQGGGRFKK